MKAEPQTQTKATSSSTPVQTGFIQRKCACGGSASPAGDCQGCKKKQHPLQRYPADQGTPDNQANSVSKRSNSISQVNSDTHFGHRFSDVAIHRKAEPARAQHDHSAGGHGATGTQHHPDAILDQLGSGQPFGGSSRSRMESVFRRDFSQVRVHVDSSAAQLSNSLNAQAFTIGNHIAFASGRYQPGTVIGDALLAHELAHVSQQSNANGSAVAMQAGGAAYDALERDADISAADAVVSLWGRAKGLATGVVQTAMPRMQSGLRLSRCVGGMKCDKKVEGATTCDQICDEAYKDSNCNQGGGGVICNGATMCACVFDMPAPLDMKRGECPELDKIVKIHEERHFPDQDCDPKKGLHRPPAKDQSKLTAGECTHRKESSSLLDEAIKKATEPCKTKLTGVKSALDTWVKANCGGP